MNYNLNITQQHIKILGVILILLAVLYPNILQGLVIGIGILMIAEPELYHREEQK